MLLWFNHDITFITSANNALAHICYITNYARKKDTSQYQRIMGTAFVKSVYDESQSSSDIIGFDINVGLPNKFSLRAFNRLVYNREISGPLIANLLLRLPKYYTMPRDVRSINIGLLYNRFSKIALGRYNHVRDKDNYVVLQQQTNTLPSLLDYYFVRETRLRNFCLFDYIWVIIVILCKKKQVNDIDFADDYRNGTFFVHHHITKGKSAIVKLVGYLYDNMDSDDDVSIDNSNFWNDNITMLLLTLFVP